MSNARIQSFDEGDLREVGRLRPDGWPDLGPYFEFYLRSHFCRPLKLVREDRLIGVGNFTRLSGTGWISHLIVSPEARGKGFGSLILESLLASNQDMGMKTVSLIATDAGEPLYRKFGFVEDAEHVFLHREAADHPVFPEPLWKPFTPSWREEILALDRGMSGEDRQVLAASFLADCRLLFVDGELCAVHFPTWGEGLTIARDPREGLDILGWLAGRKEKIALPSGNQAALDFLKNSGYRELRRAKRMYLGERLEWKPEWEFSRAGGNWG